MATEEYAHLYLKSNINYSFLYFLSNYKIMHVFKRKKLTEFDFQIL